MNTDKMNELPSFFKSKDEGSLDLGYENLQDFFISWTLRCAEENYNKVNPLLQNYAKKILFKLMFDNPNENYFVKEVKAWRQINQIDLLLEVFLLDNLSNESKHVIVIENKYYSNISSSQLIKYSNYIDSKYNQTDFRVLKVVLHCDSEKINNSNNIKLANESNFVQTTVEHLKEVIGKDFTGNYMFDEYWFKYIN